MILTLGDEKQINAAISHKITLTNNTLINLEHAQDC